MSQTIDILTRCPQCGKETVLTVDYEMYYRWKAREIKIQDAFPDMLPSQREMLITGICAECWGIMFAPIEDEEDVSDCAKGCKDCNYTNCSSYKQFN